MRSVPSELARSALDAAPDAMIIIDETGTIRFANRQVSALFGYPHDDIVGRPVESLMPQRFRERHVNHRHAYIDSLRVRPMGIGLELFGRRVDGVEFPVEISLSPVEGEGKSLVAAAIRDVSDRKRVGKRNSSWHGKRQKKHAKQRMRPDAWPMWHARPRIAPTRPRVASWPLPVTICGNRCNRCPC